MPTYDQLSNYNQWKVDVKRWFEYTLLRIDGLFSFEYAFRISVGAVGLWWVLFGGFMQRIVVHTNEKGGEGVACHHIQTRFLLYNQMASVSITYSVFTFLSDSMLLVVVSNLLAALDCTYVDPAYTIGEKSITPYHLKLKLLRSSKPARFCTVACCTAVLATQVPSGTNS